MDITSLSNEAIGYLAPAMPFLLATGKTLRHKAIEKVGQNSGKEEFKFGKSLWAKIGARGGLSYWLIRTPVLAKTLTEDAVSLANSAESVKTTAAFESQ